MQSFMYFPSNCAEKAHRLRKIIFSPRQWSRITNQLTEQDRILNEIELEKSIRSQRHLHSLKMTKNWPTSLENIQARQNLDRENRAKEDKRLRETRANAIAKEYNEEKEKLLKNCNKKLFYHRDSTKGANSALNFADILRQREEQIKLNKEIEAKEIERNNIYRNEIKESVLNDLKDIALLKRNKFLKEKQYRQELADEIERRKQVRQNEREMKIQNELEEKRCLEEELELKKLAEQAFKKKDIQIFQNNYDRAVQMKNAIKERIRLEEIDDERLRKVINNAQKDMSRLRKYHDQDDQRMKIQKTEIISQLLKSTVDPREADELQIYEKDVQRQEKSYNEKTKKLEKHRKNVIDDIYKQERDVRLKERLDKEEANRKLKVDMENRFKEKNEIEIDEKIQIEKKKRHILQRRHSLQIQVDEKKKIQNEERKDDKMFQIFLGDQLECEDNEFFKYMNVITKDSQKKNRPLYPLNKFKKDFKRKYNLNQRSSMSELARHTRSRIPFGPPCPPLLEIRPCTVSSQNT